MLVLTSRHARDPEPIIAEGRWHGTFIDTPRGSGGFGYDPYFLDASGLTAAELPLDRKNEVSTSPQRHSVALSRLDDEQAGTGGA